MDVNSIRRKIGHIERKEHKKMGENLSHLRLNSSLPLPPSPFTIYNSNFNTSFVVFQDFAVK